MAPRAMPQDEKREVLAGFKEAVNMTPAALRKWLEQGASKKVGMTKDGDKVTESGQPEAVGHRMGRRILEIKATKQAELSEQDYRDMRKVVGYVHRHQAQKPDGDVKDTRWRKSLMNWGHDPLK